MFEFHGWVNIKVDDSDDADIDILDTRLNELSEQIENKINNTESPNCILRLYRGLNGENHLIMTGFRNHRQQKIIDLFRWIAERQPFSYGLLHVRDDEESGYENVFRVFSMARGKVKETTEELLSPCIPKIEPSW
jgi:hypothetical protein